jgi:hypothetical protein
MKYTKLENIFETMAADESITSEDYNVKQHNKPSTGSSSNHNSNHFDQNKNYLNF